MKVQGTRDKGQGTGRTSRIPAGKSNPAFPSSITRVVGPEESRAFSGVILSF